MKTNVMYDQCLAISLNLKRHFFLQYVRRKYVKNRNIGPRCADALLQDTGIVAGTI
jgi:hypothetical protein